jgi:hypothetical protein
MVIRTSDDEVEVRAAPDVIAIADELLALAARGGTRCLEVAEGWLRITATNGTWVYRLTGRAEEHVEAWRAVLHSSPEAQR